VNVLLIGATGYIGTGIDEALRARGHRTIGVARSDAAKAKLAARGTASVDANLANPRSVVAAAHDADAVIFAAQVTDDDTFRVESGALGALAKALEGTGKPFVYCSGCWIYGETGSAVADESFPLNPPELVARRPQLEQLVLESGSRGARAAVVRPGLVYGRGAGVPAMLVESARERKAATIVGSGENHWAVIEVGDLGQLFALALEKAPNGSIYNATDESAYTVRELAEAASRGAGAGGATFVMPRETAISVLGEFGEALMLDQRLTSQKARKELGWEPKAPSILEDLERGSYTAATVVSEVLTGED
jgi:nucleoside-diphosphate-sugar epimerase